MINAEKKMVYKAFGLTVLSEIPLPELTQNNIKDDLVDILVEKADLSALWSEQSYTNDLLVVKENFIMFKIPETAIFMIKNGNEIFVSPKDGSCEDEIRLYILGTCMGAILLQRKILPLHGSAIAIDGKAYAFVGDSGAGKSTLAAAFLNRGYRLLSDDVIPVSLSEENNPVVTPTYPQQKLWLESLNQFGLESSHYKPIKDRESKFTIPVQSQFAEEPMPLAGVFELVKTQNNELEIVPVQKMERFLTLFNNTFRNFFIEQSGLMEWHFTISAKLVNKITIYQLHRPISRFTAPELTDLILNIVKKEEKVYE
jgi:hypothetical protein